MKLDRKAESSGDKHEDDANLKDERRLKVFGVKSPTDRLGHALTITGALITIAFILFVLLLNT